MVVSDDLIFTEISPIFKKKLDQNKENYRAYTRYFMCQRPLKVICAYKLIFSRLQVLEKMIAPSITSCPCLKHRKTHWKKEVMLLLFL